MLGVRRRMWNWRRRRISTVFEYVRIVEAAFFWYTFGWEKAAFFNRRLEYEKIGRESAMDNMKDVFAEYQRIYQEILGSFYPAKNSIGLYQKI